MEIMFFIILNGITGQFDIFFAFEWIHTQIFFLESNSHNANIRLIYDARTQ